MKALASALALFLFVFAGVSSAHAQAVKPMQKATVVIVQTPDSAAVALHKLAAVFVAQGYTVEKLDKEFFTLTLAPKTLPTTFSPVLRAHAHATAGANSVIQLTADFSASVMNHPLNDIAQLYGSEKGVYSSSFRAIEKAALSYPSGKVSYAR